MALGMGMLGWTPDQFWQSTLPDLLQALKGHEEQRKDTWWRAGEQIAAVYNVQRDTKKHGTLDAVDIFPFLLTPKERAAREWSKLEAQMLPDAEDDGDVE